MFIFEQGRFQVRAIQVGDNVNKLSLGKESYTPLKTFLRKTALNFHFCNIAKTYVLMEDAASSRVWGYITLMNGEIILNENQRTQDLSVAQHYETFPAVKIARLAVDKLLQGQGAGKGLLRWVIELVKDKISSYVGCRFLVVDSKRESIPFYEKFGFILFKPDKNDEYPSMYLDLFNVSHHVETGKSNNKNSVLFSNACS